MKVDYKYLMLLMFITVTRFLGCFADCLIFYVLSGPIYHYSPSVISITMGKQHEAHMSPHSFLRTQLYLPEGKFVKFNFSYPASSLIGIYSARNVHPSHARYDFFEILDGRKPVSSRRGQRSLRSLDAMVRLFRFIRKEAALDLFNALFSK